MSTWLLFYSLLCLISSHYFLKGTFSSTRLKRYLRAENSSPGEFPWQVLIKQGEEDWHICGGTLLNENWILTAGHCLRTSEGQHSLDYEIILGEYDRHSNEGTEVISKIEEIRLYPKYETLGHSFDMAVAKLKTPLDFNLPEHSHLKPVCLALNGLNVSNLKCTGTGWGRMSRSGTMPSLLQKLDMKAFPLRQCANYHRRFHRHERVSGTHICMVSVKNPFPESGESYGAACAGDSGGPLQCLVRGEWFQVGVAWSNTDCEQNPTVFNRVDKYADWIKNVTGYKLPFRCNV